MSAGSDYGASEVEAGSDCDDLELPPESQTASHENAQSVAGNKHNDLPQLDVDARSSNYGTPNLSGDGNAVESTLDDLQSLPDSGPSFG
ncbi:hypothetical protein KEM54_001689, partial [Ascosphaera aggregata]